MLDGQLKLLKRRLEKLETQAAIASKAKELTESLENAPTLHYITNDERKLIADFKERLKLAMREALPAAILISENDDFLNDEIDVFVANYVEDHWLDLFSHLSTTADHLPRRVVFRAIHDYLDEFEYVREDRGYALEVRRTLRPPKVPSALRWAPRLRNHIAWWVLRPERRLRAGERDGRDRRLSPRELSTLGRSLRALALSTWRWALAGRAFAASRSVERPYFTTRSAGEYRHAKRHEWIQRKASAVQVYATGVTALFMVMMFAYGILHLVLAGIKGFSDPSGSYEHVMKYSLHALEILLVAPLPYLLMIGLSRYIKALAFREDVAEYKSEIMDFKGFEIALFIAIVAAVVIERFLLGTREGGKDMTWEFAGSAAIIIGVLTTYFWIVEHQSHHRHGAHRRATLRRRKADVARKRSTAAHL